MTLPRTAVAARRLNFDNKVEGESYASVSSPLDALTLDP
jgi:hypothetical protein